MALKQGDRGEEVKSLQEQLNAAGHDAGTPDGIFGAGTDAALRAFQEARGLTVDGVAGPNTLQALAEAAAPPAPPSAVFRSGSAGDEVRQIQERLRGAGFYFGPVDGDFGGGTASAVKAFQAAQGMGADGVVGPNTWRALFDGDIPEPEIVGRPLDHRCLALTGAFEIGKGFPDCFAGLSGNFDGQGVSFGVLQWNFGQGTLQKLLGEMIASHRQVMEAVFQEQLDILKEALQADQEGARDELMEFAGSIQHPVKHYLTQPWRGMFKALGRTQECQDIQVKYAGERYRKALDWTGEYGLWSERAVALMFDINVQNGSIQRRVKARIMSEVAALPGGLSEAEREVETMRLVANLRAEASSSRWVEDVRSRKLCCANGEGSVHGVPYDLAAQFGLRLERF